MAADPSGKVPFGAMHMASSRCTLEFAHRMDFGCGAASDSHVASGPVNRDGGLFTMTIAYRFVQQPAPTPPKV
jgi:hypothetical protein